MSTVLASARGRRSRTFVWRLGVALRLAAVGAVAALAAGFIVFTGTIENGDAPALQHAQGIVALTGGAERVSGALALLLDGEGDRLLISGVNPSTTAADIARLAPQSRPLLDCCIELGYAAENTLGNARETRGWVGRHKIRSLIVVTSDYHMPRALAELGDAVPGVALIPFPVTSDRTAARGSWGDVQRLRLILVEYAKYLAVLARTHLHPAAPRDDEATSLGVPHLRQGGPCSSCARSSSISPSTSL